MVREQVVTADRFFPSGQLYSARGAQWRGAKESSIREWTCPVCGEHHGWDANDAKNGLNKTLRLSAQTICGRAKQGPGAVASPGLALCVALEAAPQLYAAGACRCRPRSLSRVSHGLHRGVCQQAKVKPARLSVNADFACYGLHCEITILNRLAAQQLSSVRSQISGTLSAGTRYFPNHATGNFCARIAGRLGCEVIRLVMDDNCFPNHFIDRKPIGQTQGECKSIVAEQRRQVSGVVWMLAAAWIVMGHCVCERVIHVTAAVRSFVNMKPENPFLAGMIRLGQTADLGEDNHPGAGLIEPHST